MSLNDVYTLVKSMEARMVAQETKLQTQEQEILALKRDNSELWQEIHRLKGPRFPFEIFSLIILSIGETQGANFAPCEKKALTTFSLVSRGWMSVTRGVLFKRITHSAILYAWDLQGIQRSMPQSIRNNIKEVSIEWPEECDMSEFAAFVLMFTALETLSTGSQYSQYAGDSESTKDLVSPPSSVRELSFWGSTSDDLVAPTVLKWFVDLHSGVIDTIDPGRLQFKKPVEFGRFLARFGPTLSKIKFMISGDEGAVQFLHSGYCAALPQLKSIQLDFWQQTFSYSYFDKSFLSTIEWLPKILALLPPSIEEIILSMDKVSPMESAAPEHKLGTIKWPQLDQSLTGSQYPSLRILKIRMPPCRYYPEVKKHMEGMWPKLLPICVTKGILETDTQD
ncbi:hypothetical protein C8R44DRAFT_759157 [Mycena epipterygia]|nr:hypothetical protein C8R44DRAFT_759157 [Mycena epipterygia]